MTVVPPRQTRFARALRATVCAAAVLLGACSHSNPPPPGTPVLTMNDLTNSGDFVSYIATIDSIQLTRNDGTVVAVLATPQTVDFAHLNTRTELVAAPAVPDGTYTSALITIDWTATPSVYLNNGGQTLSAAPQNVSGTAMAAVGVPVTFDPSHPLVIPQSRSVRLHVAVDLTASNELTTTSPSAVVQVQPFVVITPAPVDATVMRLRGLFVTTQTLPSGFYMNARPFYDLVSAYGSVIVNTNAQTYFNINGVTYTGAAGLAALAPLQENVPLAVYGTLDNLSGITPTFNATEVYVGTGQESQLAYYLTGTVTARSGDTLTLRAADYLTPLGVTGYTDSIPVTLGGSTAVFEDGIATPGLTSASVSVGQQITVAGQPPANATSLTSIDASSGIVRLHPTTLWGMLNADATLDVLSLGGFGQAQLNFAGTGTTGHDATPAAYVVDTSAVPAGPATSTGELLQVQGKVAPFGAAPPDFIARTVTPGPNTLQTLVVAWGNGGSTHPFTSISSSGLVVNLADANLGATHEIRTGPAALDLKTLPASPVITTAGADQTNLQLAVGSATLTKGISVFNSATGFANAVSSAFNGTNKIFRLVAYGQCNNIATCDTFVASRISVALHE
jgi:hypothetical protein